jgi:hypothetical protein
MSTTERLASDLLKAAIVSRLQLIDCEGENVDLTRSQLMNALAVIDQLERLRELLQEARNYITTECELAISIDKELGK